jgi:hypothetical protein
LFYQVFNKDNTDNVNDQRFAAYITMKNIENVYKYINNANTILNKPLFTPTTIMELENFHKHAFVIRNVYFNSHKRLVFMVSTKEIKLQNNTSKKLTQIPSGKFKHVRFDIDDFNISTLKEIWSETEEICKTYPSKVLNSDGKNYPYCDKPVPPFPENEDDVYTTVPGLIKNNKLPSALAHNIKIYTAGSALCGGLPD